MPYQIGWQQIALRLVLTIVAGAMLGINRSERGRPAGLRTTLLVCLAASIAMIEANLLLVTQGKGPSSFAVMDTMRFPLGILTGMGFIGAGAVMRRGGLIIGVTTAATLWFSTVVGLCIGGGQVILGMSSAVIGLLVLWTLRRLEHWLDRERRGSICITAQQGSLPDDELRSILSTAGVAVRSWSVSYAAEPGTRTVKCEVAWRRDSKDDTGAPRCIEALAQHSGLLNLAWKQTGSLMK